jgi:hypothetical protein
MLLQRSNRDPSKRGWREGLVSKSAGREARPMGWSSLAPALPHPCVTTLTSKLHHEEMLHLEMATITELIVLSAWFVVRGMDENGSNTNGYHRYYICFHISVQIRIQIWIVLTIPDMI